LADKKADEARADAADAAAGMPATLEEAVEALPEKDKVQKAYKDQMQADSAAEEVAAKKVIVQESPDAAETPSGAALLAVAGEGDPIKQGEKYERVKRVVRLGSAEDAKDVK
jgi:hypothetical protein